MYVLRSAPTLCILLGSITSIVWRASFATYKSVGSFDATSCRTITDTMNASPLKQIVLILPSENSVLRCRLVISASFGCFQLPGLSVIAGWDACLTGVVCSFVVTFETAEGSFVVTVDAADGSFVATAESAEEDIAAVGFTDGCSNKIVHRRSGEGRRAVGDMRVAVKSRKVQSDRAQD